MRFPLCPDFWDTQYIVFLNIKQFETSKWENTVNKKKEKVYYYLVLVIAFTIAWKETDFIIGSDIMITKNVILSPIYCITDTTILKWLKSLYLFSFFSPPHPLILHSHAHVRKCRPIPSSSSKIFLLHPLLIPLTYRTQTLTLNFGKKKGSLIHWKLQNLTFTELSIP